MVDFQNLFATPQAFLEIYPHEGGSYAITRNQLLSCSTKKFMKEPAGSFTITLAPGGPKGPNVGPSWLDVITPMSFAMIGMSRGQFSNIVMLGVVTNISESWAFPTSQGETVQRNTIIRGMDFGYFFTHFSWYALTFLNVSAAGLTAALGAGGNTGALGTLPNQGGGLNSGTPDQVGASWYSNVMDGGSGILSRTWIENGLNNPVMWKDAMAVQFEQYISAAKVFFSFTYVNAEENWYDKFTKIFPYPFYEFFIMTAPAGFYSKALSTTWNTVNTGINFTMQRLGSKFPSQINIIARVNPFPYVQPGNLTASAPTGGPSESASSEVSNGQQWSFGNIDMTAWNNLPLFQEDTSLLRTTEQFSEAEVRNFFFITSPYLKTQFGGSNNAVTPPLLQLQCTVDPGSVHRFGFRPVFMETEWLSDPQGIIAQTGSMNLAQVLATMTMQLSSQYEPVSLMMQAARVGALRPDIIPGCKFQYQPLKEPSIAPWIFYIEGVEHNYVFGGQSTTTLTLSRGLPAPVYGNAALLKDIHVGNAERLNGGYQTGLPQGPNNAPETGLEVVNLLSPDVQKVLSDIAPIYSTAGVR